MGIRVPRNSPDLLALRGVAAVRRSARTSRWWAGALILVVLASVPILRADSDSSGISALAWILAPFLAALGWAYAARRAELRARSAFLVFQGAAILGMAGHLVCAYQGSGLLGGPSPSGMGTAAGSQLLLLPAVPIAVGVVFALGLREVRSWTPRLAADTTLLLLVTLAVALRLVVEPAIGGGGTDLLEHPLLKAFRAMTLIPVLLAMQLVLRRGTALSPPAAGLLLAATLAFATAALAPLAGIDAHPFSFGDPSDSITLAGWALFAAAGYSAPFVPATASAMLARRRTPEAVRRLIVPVCALFIAVAVVDMGLGRPPRPETVLAVAMVALMLAIRTGQAFSIADRESSQRRQLAHTRALVAVTHALAGTTELDQTLRVISESARSVLGTRGAGIELLTDDGQGLETRSVVGLPEEVLGLRFPLEGSFTGWVVRHQEPRATVDASRDPYVQPQSLRFLGRWPVAAAPIHFRDETLGALFACIRSEPFDAEELELMGALAQQAAIAIQQARLFEQVTVLSVTDPLTGVANRRQLELELQREFAAARRGRDLTAVIFDLDRFKEYNDTNGHLAGDQALQAFARSLQEETRAMNLAARYGGDEFVAVLAGTDAAGARTFIDRVRTRFALYVEELGHGPLSVSAGLARFGPEMASPDELLRAADDELYKTKPHVRA